MLGSRDCKSTKKKKKKRGSSKIAKKKKKKREEYEKEIEAPFLYNQRRKQLSVKREKKKIALGWIKKKKVRLFQH